jgi:hypothetical protein
MAKSTNTNKTIEVSVRFFTNKLSRKGEGWTSGTVSMVASPVHGITSPKARIFNSLLQLPAVIEKTLKEHGIKLHISKGMKKYVVPRP